MDSDLSIMVEELQNKLEKIDSQTLDDVANIIAKARKVYVYGCGRSGFSMRAFAMRIMHLGKSCYFVHDTCVPPIDKDDIMFVASGSGNTESTVAIVKRAGKIGAKVILISSNQESTIAKMADYMIYIPLEEFDSIQFQGNCYDEAQYIIQDAMIHKTRKILNLTREDMDRYHTNIE